MAENWEDYGKVGEEEEYQSRSTIRKIFSFRTLKKVLKWSVYLLLISLYAVIMFRLISSKPSKKMTALLRTPDSVAYLSEHGTLSVFSQELDTFITTDGYYTIYDVRLIAETNELQFTVRYNKSTVEALRDKIWDDHYTEAFKKYAEAGYGNTECQDLAWKDADAALAEKTISDEPFTFMLKDEDGNVYSAYSCVTYSRTRYKYIRVSFKIPDLFRADVVSPELYYPSPDKKSPLYIYKGTNAAECDESLIKTLSFSLVYDGEPFGNSIDVYRASKQIERYDYKKEMRGGVTENIQHSN